MNALQKVFGIIELLENRREMRLQEIADALRLQKSTAHRLTTELCASGYLHKSPDTKTYTLGTKFLEISSRILDTMDIRDVARPTIERINRLTQETIHLGMLVDRQVIYIDKVESPRAVRMYSQIGKVAPLYCTGVGKAILAFQPAKVAAELLAGVRFTRYTENTIVDRKALARELSLTRKRGYALDNEEHEPHVGCIAVPLWDHSRQVIASASITAIMYRRMRIERLLEYRDLLIEASEEISCRMGFTGAPTGESSDNGRGRRTRMAGGKTG